MRKLKENEIEQLQRLLKKEKRAKIQKRLLFLKFKQKNLLHKEIEDHLQVCRKTLTNWITMFNEGGLERLCQLNYDGRKESKLEKVRVDLEKKIDQENIISLTEIQTWLWEEKEIKSCISNIHYFLKKNGIFPLKKLE